MLNHTAKEIQIACCNKKHVFQTHEVIRLEAFSNYTKIYSINQPPLTVAKVLSKFENLFGAMGFIRMHRSHLVNPLYINRCDFSGKIMLVDNTVIELPRRKKQAMLSKISAVGLLTFKCGR